MTTDSVCVSKVVEALVADASEDYMGLWQIVRRVSLRLGSEDAAAVRTETLVVARKLLQHGLLVGDLANSGGFNAWTNQAPDVVVSRIEAEWGVLGRLPDIGDICWFDRPPMGDEPVGLSIA